MPMRVAVVQFAPKIGEVQYNVEKATKLLSDVEPGTVDLVCLPEMIFSGYVFKDADAISPYLEDPETGPTSRFCAALSKRLGCYVIAGYPEALGPAEPRSTIIMENYEHEEVGANSAMVYAPDGTRVGNYRKTNPFETDKTWAKPGTGFATYNLPHPLRTLALGICMDLNAQPPALWTLEDGPYELAQHCVDARANVLLLLNAWLDSGAPSDDGKDWSTLNFWVARLRPLWAESSAGGHGDEDGPETTVIVCNRSGEENGEKFAGTSAIYSLRRGSGRPRLLHSMDRTTEGVAIWTV
ncbi:carbon-nitrogen hydrolase [Phanerochaete sordida]|uniref:Carbon-nitrogen hydrolase n=1 Tax=Phanerochaete sordida TaxID=48140 RepID=A0A9P3G561_9APHY|nr:carbon-nitrogen hydrolase [Phanerochaete sordida]